MPRKKETRYGGKYNYLRRRLRGPDGRYVDIYARTTAELEEKIRDQQAAWAAARSAEEDPFFVDYAAAWYKRMAGDWTKARSAQIRREINNNLAPVLGTKKLSEITSDDVQDVMARRAGLSRSSREKTLQLLRRILSAAEEAGKIPRDPSRKVKAGGRASGKKDALTPEQEATLLAAVAGLPVELPIRLGLYTGMRREEVYGLQWRDVHLDGAAPHIDVRRACRWPDNNQPEIAEILKSSAAWRTLPIPPALLPALRELHAAVAKKAKKDIGERTVVELPGGGPWSYQAHRSAWSAVEARSTGTVRRRRKDPATGEIKTVEIRKELGDVIPKHPGVVVTIDFPVASHILRHTYITRLILGGVDVKRVQYLAGHEAADVTLEIYTTLMGHRPEDLIDDVSAIFPG